MSYHLPVSLVDSINSDTWKEVRSGWSLYPAHMDAVAHRERDAEYVSLDLQQKYQIADAAPAWDCLASDFYDEMAEEVGFVFDDKYSCEDLMAAVEDYLAREQ